MARLVWNLLGPCLLAVALWHYNATDWPEEHPDVNDAELQMIHPGSHKGNVGVRSSHTGVSSVPWLRMLASPSVWSLGYCLLLI